MIEVVGVSRLPKRHKNGSKPALEFSRASLARKIIRARIEAGLS